jgi:hypothetical protein
VQVQFERFVCADATTVADFPDDALDIHRVTVRLKPDTTEARYIAGSVRLQADLTK